MVVPVVVLVVVLVVDQVLEREQVLVRVVQEPVLALPWHRHLKSGR